MSRLAMLLIVVCACAAPGAGEIRIFFTSSEEPYGLTNPALAFKPSMAVTSDDGLPNYSNNVDAYHYQVAAFPTYRPNHVPWTMDGFFYIWLQFGPGEAPNAFLHQLCLGVRAEYGDFSGVETCFYKMDSLGIPGVKGKRWAGPSNEADNYASFRQNPQLLVAGTPANRLAWGLNNHAPVGANPNNLYHAGGAIGGDGNRIYLLGAVKTWWPGIYDAFITTFDDEYQIMVDGVVRSPADVVLGSFEFDPAEPASLVLLSLLMALRRR